MKNIKNIPVLFLSVVLVAFAVSSCGSSGKVDNKINGGFENADSGDESPDGWYANSFAYKGEGAKLTVDNDISHSGGSSISIVIPKSGSVQQTVYNWVRRVDYVKPKEVYELEGWIKTKNTKRSPFIEVQCWNDKTRKIVGSVTTVKKYNLTGTNNWKQVRAMFEVPPHTTKMIIRAGINSTQNKGSIVWFDDIKLNKVR